MSAIAKGDQEWVEMCRDCAKRPCRDCAEKMIRNLSSLWDTERAEKELLLRMLEATGMSRVLIDATLKESRAIDAIMKEGVSK